MSDSREKILTAIMDESGSLDCLDLDFDLDEALLEPPPAARPASNGLGAVPLFRAKPPKPSHLLQKEKPVHRLMAGLIAKGMTQPEVAQLFGVTKETVSNLTRQPFFQDLLLKLIDQNKAPQIAENLLNGAVAMATMRVITLAQGVGVPPAVSLKAAESILNRVLGVPGKEKEQAVELDQEASDELDAALDETQRQIDQKMLDLKEV